MTKNDQELLDLIRNSDNPQQAMVTAIDIICQYIKQQREAGDNLDFCEQKS